MILAACLLAAFPAQEGEAPAPASYPDLQPTIYRSPSGEWELFVDPSAPDGAGEATYELSRNGELQWSTRLSLTFWDAILTDDGVSAGYGYSDGVGMWSGRLIIFLLDQEGTVRRLDSMLRGPSRFPDYLAVPSGLDLFHHPDLGVVVVIIGDRETGERGQEWRIYDIQEARLRTATRPKEFQRGAEDLGAFLGGQPVPGTPLFLAHWAGNFVEDSIRFSLVGILGRPSWTLDYADERVGLEAESARIDANGYLLPSSEPATIELWFRNEAERVRYALEAGAGVWSLHELGRETLVVPDAPPVEALEAIPRLTVSHLGSIDVSGSDEGATGVHDVGAFTVDRIGRLAYLPADQHGEQSLTLVDTKGNFVQEYPLDVDGAGKWVDVSWEDRGWFLLIRRVAEGGEIWALDVADGSLTRVPIPRWKATTEVKGLADGGILIQRGQTVLCFDPAGTERWQRKGKAIAVLAQNQIAILATDGSAIHLVSDGGTQRDEIDLQAVWKARPSAGTTLERDIEGGVVLVDSARRVLRMRLDGVARSIFTPTYENGREFQVRRSVQLGPLGRIWTTDRSTLLRLNEDGVVDRRLGQGPGERTGDAETVAIGPNGRIYAAARETENVRIMEADGTPVVACDSGPLETVPPVALQEVTLSVDAQGQVLLSGRKGVFVFSPGGRLIDVEERAFDPIRETWYAMPQNGERLVVGHRRAYLLDQRGEVRREIVRRLDGRWLKHLFQASIAPDGSFALLTGLRDERGERQTPGIHLYTAEGDPIRTLWAPVETETLPYVAYDGEQVVYLDECVAYLFDAEGNVLGSFQLPGEPGITSWQPILPPDTGELWVFDLRHTIERYALP